MLLVGSIIGLEAALFAVAQAAPTDAPSIWNLVLQLPIAGVCLFLTLRFERRADAAGEREREANQRERETAREVLPALVECTDVLRDVAQALQGTAERVRTPTMGVDPARLVEDLVARINRTLDDRG